MRVPGARPLRWTMHDHAGCDAARERCAPPRAPPPPPGASFSRRACRVHTCQAARRARYGGHRQARPPWRGCSSRAILQHVATGARRARAAAVGGEARRVGSGSPALGSRDLSVKRRSRCVARLRGRVARALWCGRQSFHNSRDGAHLRAERERSGVAVLLRQPGGRSPTRMRQLLARAEDARDRPVPRCAPGYLERRGGGELRAVINTWAL